MAGQSPLVGPDEPELGVRFLDMLGAYDADLRALAHRAATDKGFSLREGVYAMVGGPAYESMAEIRFLQRAGADAALPTMQASDAALGNIATALQQARTLTQQANNSTISADQRQTIAGQIAQVQSQILSLANTQVDGRYIFAGTKSDAAPFTAGPPVTYTGNNTPLELSLAAGAQFSISVPGQALLNARAGTDLFQTLTALESAVRSGDAQGMATGLSTLDDDLNNVTRQQADIGAREQYVQMLRQQSDANLTATQSRQSQLENVDLAAAILDEKTAENANQAALAMAGRVGQISLLNYLQ